MTQLPLEFTSRPTADLLISMLRQKVPARARNTDPKASHVAAASWDDQKLTWAQAHVLSFFLAKQSGTDGELEEWIKRTYPQESDKFGPSSLRKRRGDLVEKGILRNSGRKDEHRKMTIWEIAQ